MLNGAGKMSIGLKRTVSIEKLRKSGKRLRGKLEPGKTSGRTTTK